MSAWNDRYDEPEYLYGKLANDFLQQQYHHIKPAGRVLCLAEGEGRNAVFLAEQGFEVVAVDLSAVGLTKALTLAEEKGVKINTEVADLADYDFGVQQWDAIVSIWAHVPPALRQQIHKKIAPALSENGVFILEAYTFKHTQMQGIGGPPASKPEMFMSLAGLETELEGLKTIVGVETERQISEGKLHQGLSAVVQYVGKKLSSC